MLGDQDPLTRPAAGSTATIATPTGPGAALVGLGMLTMNVLAYAFMLVAAHLLGPTDFGAVAALLAILVVANVGSLAIQANAARRLEAAYEHDVDAVRNEIRRNARWLALALGVVLLAAVPLLDRGLQLDDWVASGSMAPTCAALTMTGAYAGIAHGERRWGAVSAIYLTMGAGRVAGGTIALLIDTSPRSAMIGVAVGSILPLVVGWRLCPSVPAGSTGDRPVIAELWASSHTMLAFVALTNLDVLLARPMFSDHTAGIYAAGSILTKTCLFLLTFVLATTFPATVSDRAGRPWGKPVLLVLVLGGCVVLGALLLPGLAQSFAGGGDYDGLGHVAWVFALEATAFAALQILVYDMIAGHRHSATLVTLGIVAVVAVAVPIADSVTTLALIMAGTALVIALILAALPRSEPDPIVAL